MKIDHLVLSQDDRQSIEQLLNQVFALESCLNLRSFLIDASVLAHQLPISVRRRMTRFRVQEWAAAICIHGNPIGMEIGPTPKLIPRPFEKSMVTREEALLLLYSSLLGDPFTWSSIQNGNLINEIIPISENADKPMSSGSANVFGLHTEDAFHDLRGEYLALLCLRNPSHTPTLLSCIDDVDLSETDKDLLFQKRYTIGSNVAHRVDKTESGKVGILFGHTTSPYLRINTNRDPLLDSDPAARSAYDTLVSQLESMTVEFILEPGDCLVIDNFKTAHGRSTYQPNYDGNDRWLKRVYITSSLRNSRALRETSEDRVIHLT